MKEEKEKTDIEFLHEYCNIGLYETSGGELVHSSVKSVCRAMKQFALQESRKAFEAGRKVNDDTAGDFRYYKYKTFQDYLAAETQQPLTK